jgi:hypothetical protein
MFPLLNGGEEEEPADYLTLDERRSRNIPFTSISVQRPPEASDLRDSSRLSSLPVKDAVAFVA